MVTYDIDTSRGLHCLGKDLLSIMVAYQDLLEKIHPKVIDMPDFSRPNDEQIGMFFKFNDRFRTKNAPWPDRKVDYSSYLKGDFEKDPQIYKMFGDWKLIMIIDPMWITTTTAFSDFAPSGGHNKFSGLAMIKSIDPQGRVITATPLVIGLPRSPLHDIFNMNVSEMPRTIDE